MYNFVSLQAVEIPGVRIVQIAGGLNFANKDYLQHKILNLMEKQASYDKQNTSSPAQTIISPTTQSRVNYYRFSILPIVSTVFYIFLLFLYILQPLCLVLDMVSVSFVDPSAVKALLSLHKDAKSQGRILCLSNCSCK